MNSEQIDDLIDAIASDDYDRILMYADIEIKDNRTAREFYMEVGKEKILPSIMKKIEEGDYNYFLSIEDSINVTSVHALVKLMLYSSKEEDIKNIIQNCQKFDLKDDDVVDLIKATKDIDYIKSFVEDKENRNKIDLVLWSDQVIDLIIATRDIDYIKNLIEDIDKRIEINLLVEEEDLIKLIKATNDSDYIKEFIESNEKREKCGVYISYAKDFVDLIIATKDVDYIKSFINCENIDNGFSFEEFQDLIEATNDPKYIESIIEDEQKREELQLSYEEIFGLIEATNDKEYIKEYIENGEKRRKLNLEFDSLKAIFLIKSLEDAEYIKDFINSKEKRDKAEIDLLSSDVAELIISTHDTGFIKSCIEDKSKREELKLDEDFSNYLWLIEKTHDSEYIQSYIEDERKREDLGIKLDKENLKRLIKATDDAQYIKKFIQNDEKRQKFRLKIDDIITCIEDFSTKNCNDAVKELLKFQRKEKHDYKRKLKIPQNMTFGIEIESEGRHFNLIHRLTQIIDKSWRFAEDSSLTNQGIEVISPVFSGNNDNVEKNIDDICEILKVLKQKANDDCAAHVHIGADYLSNSQAWNNLKEIWGNCETIFYIISNKAGELPRSEVGEYAEPISGRLEEEESKGTIQLNTIKDIRMFAERLQKSNRYFSINFDNIGKVKNTIEFRLANGTLDTDTWIENINLFGGIIKTAEELSQIQMKSEGMISEEEKRRLNSFERIKEDGISRDDKFEALIETICPEEDRDIYRKRYSINSKLVDKNKIVKMTIERFTARNPIRISTIGRKIFVRDDAVTGMDYIENQKIFKNKLRKEKNDLEQI